MIAKILFKNLLLILFKIFNFLMYVLSNKLNFLDSSLATLIYLFNNQIIIILILLFFSILFHHCCFISQSKFMLLEFLNYVFTILLKIFIFLCT